MTDPDDVLAFVPVPLTRLRARGWSADQQHAFIAMLARCGVVAHAARSVGMSARSAYHLRGRPGADSFAAAWDWALEMGLDAARDAAMEQIAAARAQPLVRRGRIVGTRHGEDHRLIFAAMRAFSAEVRGRRAAMPHRLRMDARALRETFDAPWPWDPDVPRPPETIEPGDDMKNPIEREKCEVKRRPAIRAF
ncbi:hypothetical protein WG908_03875 [Sphingobium sp. AN641]|uniref:hypothetical protein n=1 Tax=Sphingobium sp. AN641 TaxID=3133443 RepID=UPI0030BF0E69